LVNLAHRQQISAPISLRAGERARVWMAFGGVPAQAGPARVEPIEVRLSDQPVLQLAAAEAGPRWVSDQPWRSSGLTYLEVMLHRESGHANIAMLDLRWAFDRWILNSAWGFGGRGAIFERGNCCQVGMHWGRAVVRRRSRRWVHAQQWILESRTITRSRLVSPRLSDLTKNRPKLLGRS
jgi:hypothetical protein